MNWLDWVLVIILLWSALRGFIKGFVRSIAGLAVILFGFWMALRYYRLLGDYLEIELGWGPGLTRFISEHLDQAVQGALTAPSAGTLSPLGNFFSSAVASLLQGLASFLAASALDALAFLVIFAVGVALLNMLVGAIPNLPLLAPLDRAGGFCFGLLRGFLVGILIFALVQFIAVPGAAEGDALGEAVRKSVLAPSYEAAWDYLWALAVPALGIEKAKSIMEV